MYSVWIARKGDCGGGKVTMKSRVQSANVTRCDASSSAFWDKAMTFEYRSLKACWLSGQEN